MSFITLTSDWNQNDFYLGMLKGKIFSRAPEARVVDVSHQVPSFNSAQAAFVIRNSYSHFPAGSIHLICVNTEPETGQRILAAKYESHYFIGTDNGIFGLLFREEPEGIIEVPFQDEGYISILDAFVETACSLYEGKDLLSIGNVTDQYQKQTPRRAVIEESVINGTVIYIDSYQNAFTNITRELYDRIGKGRPFEVLLASNHYRINKISKKYSEVPVGELVVLFNSLDLMEIAIHKGQAVPLLNLSVGSVIRVKFFESKQMTRLKAES
jgi:S-adenosyl-L-methionine hydrolase (adenosine-forming)